MKIPSKVSKSPSKKPTLLGKLTCSIANLSTFRSFQISNHPFFAFTDHHLHPMAETIEHRIIRSKSHGAKRPLIVELDDDPPVLDNSTLLPEHIHFPQSSQHFPCQATSLPTFVNCIMPKVMCPRRHY